MKNYLLIVGSLFISYINAQFKIQGKIENYKEKPIFINIYYNGESILMEKVKTDVEGHFKVNYTKPYEGVISLFLAEAKTGTYFLSNNKNITFTAKVDESAKEVTNLKFLDSELNTLFNTYIQEKSLTTKALPGLENLLESYKKEINNPFKEALEKELQRLRSTNNDKLYTYPVAAYYDKIKKAIDTPQEELQRNPQLLADLKSMLVGSNDLLETSGQMNNLLLTYLSASLIGMKTKEEAQPKLIEVVDQLLDEAGTDTNRGQNILNLVIKLGESYNMNSVKEKYTKIANTLTCEINPELKSLIEATNKIKEGQQFPNYKFTTKKNKFTTLYDIQTPYKLVIVSGSWCPHCQQELPLIENFYKTKFKEKGGEIVTIAIESVEQDYKNSVKDIPWITDSDLMYWNSPIVKELGIMGTPSLYLLDKDNKILKMTSKISEIETFFK